MNGTLPLLIGCFIGVGVFIIFKRVFMQDSATLHERIQSREREAQLLREENAHLKRELELQRTAREGLLEERAALTEALNREQRFGKEREQFVLQAKEQLRDVFQSVSGQALERSARLFLTMAENQLEKHAQSTVSRLTKKEEEFSAVVEPIARTLEKLDTQMQLVEKDRLSSRDAMSESISNLLETHRQLSKETVTLSNALSSPTITGQWGEMHLRRVIELAGMVNYCDFSEQVTIESEQGSQRPDLLIRLPGNRTIIVDAKAPVKSYLESCKTEEPQERMELLKHHAVLLRKHIQQLAKRRYWDAVPESAGFVVLFLPAESLLSAALTIDVELHELAMRHNVVLATPLSLIALCRTIAVGWRQQSILENSDTIARTGRELLRRLQTFTEHFDDMYRGLERSVRSYNKAVGSLESRVLVSAKQLADCGLGEDLALSAPRAIQTGLRIPSGDSSADEEKRTRIT